MSKVKTAPPDASTVREEMIGALVAGKLRFHELPSDLSAADAAAVRRAALERLTGTRLDAIGSYSFDAQTAAKRNCENLIGVAQIPMGIVGPLTVRGEHVDGDVYIPLATTEGALLASINRGCAAIRAAGSPAMLVSR